jgi:hypothetical protein
MFFNRSRMTLQIHSDHVLLDLKKVPYRDIEAITIQTTWAGYPTRMNIKTHVHPLHLEGFVRMDVLAGELLARTKTANAGVAVKIHRGPTRLQLGWLFATLVVIVIFQVLSYLDADPWIWAVVAVPFLIGGHVVASLAYRDKHPEAFPRAKRWASMAMLLITFIPIIMLGLVTLVVWWQMRHL